jgi:hypothetical protein
VEAHVSARLAWLQAWRDAYPRWSPWVLGLLDGAGDVRAAAPLARRRRGPLVQVRCLGHTTLDRSPIISRTADDADELADAVVTALGSLRRPWTMHLRQLPTGDAFTLHLASRLPAVEVRAAEERPVVLVKGPLEGRRVTSRNLRQAEAKARNRISRAGLAFDVRWLTDFGEIAPRIPEIRSVHRARDLQLRGHSLLDDREEGPFWAALLHRHRELLELLEVRLDGELGAYVLWIRNGGARLVLDNRVSPRWTTYSAGLIANNVALRAAAADPAIDVLDWGTGVQRYKLQSANKVVPHEQLQGWSSPATRRALMARRRVAYRAGS